MGQGARIWLSWLMHAPKSLLSLEHPFPGAHLGDHYSNYNLSNNILSSSAKTQYILHRIALHLATNFLKALFFFFNLLIALPRRATPPKQTILFSATWSSVAKLMGYRRKEEETCLAATDQLSRRRHSSSNWGFLRCCTIWSLKSQPELFSRGRHRKVFFYPFCKWNAVLWCNAVRVAVVDVLVSPGRNSKLNVKCYF